ncbi:MAG: DUF411 domain-containing protein [Gammaproteobacteria bacterium]|nr:DUF411 domain-containing protein [Gammaproteobacteria bacterium]
MKNAYALILLLVAAWRPATAADAPLVEVWKSPTCGCCNTWIRHLKDAGFEVRSTDLDDVAPIKQRFKVPPELSSCHTATVGGYVVEGHVPADDIVRLLRSKPKVTGIYVPGMPVGSPGMEGPNAQTYEVLAVDSDGKRGVFATHKGD